MTTASQQPVLSVVLNAMGRLELADLGFRGWMLQNWDEPYEVILSLFNDQQPRYEALTVGKNPKCSVIIKSYDRPAFFNISAANNLGLHFATGQYVMFANSDVVYPSQFGKQFVAGLRRHAAGYAQASRYNLSNERTQQLRPATEYSMTSNLDFLDREWTYVGNPSIWMGCGAWTARRDVAFAIGGFDPAVMCSEDDDFASRAIAYLAKRGEQDATIVFQQLLGFHLYHPGSELFNSHHDSHLIIDPRRDRLRKGNEAEIILPNRLDDLESLKEAMRKTVKPSSTTKYRQNTFKKIGGRLSAAGKILIGRR